MSEAPARLHSFSQLLAVLDHDQVLHQTDLALQTVSVPTRRPQGEGLMVMRWQDREGVLQLVHALPIVVPEAQMAAMEAAIARLNHALALPGFGLDHENRRLYFRTVLPITPGGVNPADVQALFRAMVRTSLDLLPPIRRVLEGGASPEGVVVDASIELTLGDGGGTLL